jgi:hypothetical protein
MKKFILPVLLFISSLAFSQLEGTKWVLADSPTALAVGSTQGSSDWWAIGENPASIRPCLFDDTIAFNADATFENIMGTETWVEAWQGVDPEACAAPVAPHDGSNAATWQYNSVAQTLTVNGLGAHIGLAKVHNNGELTDPVDAVSTIEYLVTDLTTGMMVLDINFGVGWWRFEYTKVGGVPVSIISMTDDGQILEGSEDGEVITVHLSNDTFVSTLDIANWSATNLPIGVSLGSLNRVSSTTVEVTLAGNAAQDYDTDITDFILTVSSSELVTANYNISASTGVFFEAIQEPTLLTGTKWVLADSPTALAVGSAQGSNEWWTIGENPASTRPCLFDDTIAFNSDGSFENIMGTETWVEPWQGNSPEGCDTPVAPHDGSYTATWSYNEGTGILTVNGLGAHIGLAKAINGGELTDPSGAVTSIDYIVTELTSTSLIVDINIGFGWWRFEYAPNNGTPPLPAELTMSDDGQIFEGSEDGEVITVNLSNDTFVNTINIANWSSSNLPTGVSLGSLNRVNSTTVEITLTGNSTVDYISNITNFGLTVAAAEFISGIDDLSVNSGVTFLAIGNISGSLAGTRWTLADSPTALAVGPARGSGEWWSIGDDPSAIRPCAWDDTIVFNANGSFENILGSETWVEQWQGNDLEGCDVPVAPHDGSNPATWSYNELSEMLTINGLGAYIGLAKVHNNGELMDPADAVSSISYLVSELTQNSLIVDIEFSPSYWWRFEYQSAGLCCSPPIVNITMASDGKIIEENEDLEQIIVSVENDAFAEVLNPANWTLSNAPTNVSIGSVYKTSDTDVVLTLQGNATQDYDEDIQLILTISGDEFANSSVDFTIETGVILEAIIEPAELYITNDYEIIENAEDNSVINVNLYEDVFVGILDPTNWSLENLPVGVSLGSVSRISETLVSLTLLGNATADYDTNITNVRVLVSAAEFLNTNVDVTSNEGITLTAIIEPVIVKMSDDGEIREGTESGEVITVSIEEDRFVNELTTTNWSVANIPEGVSIGELLRVNDTAAAIVLLGNTTSDYDTDITDMELVISSNEFVISETDFKITEGVTFIAELETSNIEIRTAGEFNIYPNPAREFIVVVSTVSISNISILNASGAVVYEESIDNFNKVQVNTERFGKGLYLVLINKTISQQIVIK